jgi:nucleoprotein TPR
MLMWTQVGLSEELAQEKEENRRLNAYMDQILLEIEERAPVLRQQRENYEMAMATVGKLSFLW